MDILCYPDKAEMKSLITNKIMLASQHYYKEN